MNLLKSILIGIFIGAVLGSIIVLVRKYRAMPSRRKCTPVDRKLAQMDYTWHLENPEQVNTTREQVEKAGFRSFLKARCNPAKK